MICCGESMQEIIPETTDAAAENITSMGFTVQIRYDNQRKALKSGKEPNHLIRREYK